MRQELFDILKNEYPRLFGKLLDISIRDGWYDLVYATCDVLENYIENSLSIPDELKNQIYLTTIKEKFGILRVYMSHHDDFILGTLTLAEYLSCSLCELCGAKAPGQCTIRSYVQTLCLPHKEQALEDSARYLKKLKPQ